MRPASKLPREPKQFDCCFYDPRFVVSLTHPPSRLTVAPRVGGPIPAVEDGRIPLS